MRKNNYFFVTLVEVVIAILIFSPLLLCSSSYFDESAIDEKQEQQQQQLQEELLIPPSSPPILLIIKEQEVKVVTDNDDDVRGREFPSESDGRNETDTSGYDASSGGYVDGTREGEKEYESETSTESELPGISDVDQSIVTTGDSNTTATTGNIDSESESNGYVDSNSFTGYSDTERPTTDIYSESVPNGSQQYVEVTDIEDRSTESSDSSVPIGVGDDTNTNTDVISESGTNDGDYGGTTATTIDTVTEDSEASATTIASLPTESITPTDNIPPSTEIEESIGEFEVIEDGDEEEDSIINSVTSIDERLIMTNLLNDCYPNMNVVCYDYDDTITLFDIKNGSVICNTVAECTSSFIYLDTCSNCVDSGLDWCDFSNSAGGKRSISLCTNDASMCKRISSIIGIDSIVTSSECSNVGDSVTEEEEESDCNSNGIYDTLELVLLGGSGIDINNNDVIDSCEEDNTIDVVQEEEIPVVETTETPATTTTQEIEPIIITPTNQQDETVTPYLPEEEEEEEQQPPQPESETQQPTILPCNCTEFETIVYVVINETAETITLPCNITSLATKEEEEEIQPPPPLPQCTELSCNGRGNCSITEDGNTTSCSCYDGYVGSECEVMKCGPNGLYSLSKGGCVCSTGWYGNMCDMCSSQDSLFVCCATFEFYDTITKAISDNGFFLIRATNLDNRDQLLLPRSHVIGLYEESYPRCFIPGTDIDNLNRVDCSCSVKRKIDNLVSASVVELPEGEIDGDDEDTDSDNLLAIYADSLIASASKERTKRIIESGRMVELNYKNLEKITTLYKSLDNAMKSVSYLEQQKKNLEEERSSFSSQNEAASKKKPHKMVNGIDDGDDDDSSSSSLSSKTGLIIFGIVMAVLFVLLLSGVVYMAMMHKDFRFVGSRIQQQNRIAAQAQRQQHNMSNNNNNQIARNGGNLSNKSNGSITYIITKTKRHGSRML
mgnify:CR=1 FL=1